MQGDSLDSNASLQAERPGIRHLGPTFKKNVQSIQSLSAGALDGSRPFAYEQTLTAMRAAYNDAVPLCKIVRHDSTSLETTITSWKFTGM